jgi:glycosyltransferase involved in cell wall biosynthesis
MSKPVADKKNQASAKGGTLIILTNHYPFGLYESFLESELPVLTMHFEKVVVISRDVSSETERAVPGAKVYRLNPTSTWSENLLTIGLFIRHGFTLWRYLKDELRWLKSRHRKLTTFILDDIIHTLVKALQTSRHIGRIMNEEPGAGRIVLYSYWLSSSALALTFVPDKHATIKKVARAHGGDVYEYRNANKYLPFRRTLMRNLDRIFAISDDAAAHLRRQGEPSDADKVVVSRLGTQSAGSSPSRTQRRFTVVSCAFLVPVKRVHLLVDALQLIDQHDIHWIHIGGGPLESEITAHAKAQLGPRTNITYDFPGSRTNEQLMRFYRETHVDVFVNTSSAEGIPVTIMEAQSFGIPVVAPRVGGIAEIVSEQTGRLFDADASPLAIAQLIQEILSIPANDVQALRERIIQNWNAHYNAEKNFSTFVAELENL